MRVLSAPEQSLVAQAGNPASRHQSAEYWDTPIEAVWLERLPVHTTVNDFVDVFIITEPNITS
jgi:hypothetical protein